MKTFPLKSSDSEILGTPQQRLFIWNIAQLPHVLHVQIYRLEGRNRQPIFKAIWRYRK